MLIIKNNLTIHEILQELKDLSKQTGDLKILVESFPQNLESEIGLDHFVFMLSNYPRPIIWISDNSQIFERLKSRNLNVQQFNSFSSKADRILEEIDRLSGNDTPNSYELKIGQNPSQSFDLESTFFNPDSRRSQNINPIFDRVENKTFQDNQAEQNKILLPLLPELAAKTNSKTLDLKVVKTNNSLSYTKPHDDDQNSIVKLASEEEELMGSEDEDVIFSLDSRPKPSPEMEKMRSKIIASKEVLQTINSSNTSKDSLTNLIIGQIGHISNLEDKDQETANNQSQNEAPTLSEIKKGFWSPLKYLYVLSFSLVAILSAVGVALGFPTVAYTIQVTPEKKENEALFSFDKKQINVQNFKFNLSAKTDTTGTVSTSSTRARGKVRLLNKTGANIELVFSKFYLAKGENRYNPVYDSTAQQTISIPSKNNLSGPIVEIDIESGNVQKDGDYDLKEGEELTPVNLQGVPLGPNFTAVVTQDVSSNTPQSNRTVTDGDLRTLRSTIESNLLKDKENKLSEIDSKKYVSNINWSTNVESEFNSDHKVSDPGDSVSMTASISSDLYYLDKKTLVDQILAREPDAEQVTKIEISNGETAWNKDDQKLSLEVKYIYTIKTGISEDKLKEIAQNSGLDTNTATSKIKEIYPRVSEVKSSVSGVPVPINPHIEVDVVQNTSLE